VKSERGSQTVAAASLRFGPVDHRQYPHAIGAEIRRRAANHPFVGPLFRKGLSHFKDEILGNNPVAFPGARQPLLLLLGTFYARPGEGHGRRRRAGGKLGRNWTTRRVGAFETATPSELFRRPDHLTR